MSTKSSKASKGVKSSKSPKSSKSASKSSKSAKSTKGSSKSSVPASSDDPNNFSGGINTPDDHYDFILVGNSYEYSSSTDYEYDGEWVTLSSTLKCPVEAVEELGFVDASSQDLCVCDSTLTTWLYFVLGVEDEIKPIECECSACSVETPIGLRTGFAYECESAITDTCFSFDCYENCNGEALTPPGCTVDANGILICSDGDSPSVTPPPTSVGVTPTPEVISPPVPGGTSDRSGSFSVDSPTTLVWFLTAFLVGRFVAR